MATYKGPVRPGSQGASVKEVQEQLILRGYGKLNSGQLSPTGFFGPQTEEAVIAYQAQNSDRQGHPLMVDGIVGPLTWSSLFTRVSEVTPQAASRDIDRAILQVAAGEVGTVEIPPGSNRGKKVELYLEAAGCSPGEPWCMAFVYWVCKQAATQVGVKLGLPRTAYCPTAWGWALAQHHAVTPSDVETGTTLVGPGAIFFIQGKVAGVTRPCHVGIVEGLSSGYVKTVEGNTNTDGSREGVGVFRRTRKVSSLLGFVQVR